MAKLMAFIFKLKGGNSNYNISKDKDKKKKTLSSNYSSSQEKNYGQLRKPSMFSSLPNIPGLNKNGISIYADSKKYVEGQHWRKEQIIGTGQYGTCFQALDVVSGTLMAVKQVPINSSTPETYKDTIDQLKDEIQILASLNHANIVRILGALQMTNHFNIFMEWMPGGSVSSLLGKFGSFHENVIIGYTKQVLTGLEYLHSNKILHRDLKGSNLLVDGSGRCLRISDFGAAGLLLSQRTAEGEFEGQIIGTVAFMAPEVIRGECYGRSSDIWSVGCVIIEMATAALPWNANNAPNNFSLMYKIGRATQPPMVPLTLSTSTRNLALRCLRLNPENRPFAKELLQQLVFTTANGGISPVDEQKSIMLGQTGLFSRQFSSDGRREQTEDYPSDDDDEDEDEDEDEDRKEESEEDNYLEHSSVFLPQSDSADI